MLQREILSCLPPSWDEPEIAGLSSGNKGRPAIICIMVAYTQRPEVLGLAFGVNGFSEDSKSQAPLNPQSLCEIYWLGMTWGS